MELSKMFGVEREERFMVEGGGKTLYKISAVEDNIEFLEVNFGGGHGWEFAKINMLLGVIDSAPAGIIHLPPPLTDEQRAVLMSLYTLGARWIAKDETELMWAYKEKPLRGYNVWCAKPSTSGDMKIFDDAPVSLLVSWSDPEPFDIGKALEVGE